MRVVATRAAEDRHFPFGFFDGDGHDAQVLFVRQRGAFSGRPAGHQEVNPAGDLPADQLAQRSFIQRQIFLERRDHGRAASLEICRHVVLPVALTSVWDFIMAGSKWSPLPIMAGSKWSPLPIMAGSK